MKIVRNLISYFNKLCNPEGFVVELEAIEEDAVASFNYERTLSNLQLAGWKMYISHKRYFPENEMMGDEVFLTRQEFNKAYDNNMFWFTTYDREVSTKGGYTIVTLVTPEGKEFIGRATCSMNDVYCRKTGRELALQRAVESNALMF